MRGPESEKSHLYRQAPTVPQSFYERFMRGPGIDVGFGLGNNPVLPTAIGIESADWIDGRLPFADESLHYVYSSHCLEHIEDSPNALREFHRVIRVGGFCITAVPHKFLYEKKRFLPSRWNGDHKRFYTPSNLLYEIEGALEINTYRIRHLEDNDRGFDYSIPPEQHSGGCYEIVCVWEKIVKPEWKIE